MPNLASFMALKELRHCSRDLLLLLTCVLVLGERVGDLDHS
jgi:hypothetical protein